MSKGGLGAVEGLSGYLKVEEKVGGSLGRDSTHICRESQDLYVEDTPYPGKYTRFIRKQQWKDGIWREKCISHLRTSQEAHCDED